eukprot:scaffold195678_cov20-Prasinocladus_malaysianus.AAC.1
MYRPPEPQAQFHKFETHASAQEATSWPAVTPTTEGLHAVQDHAGKMDTAFSPQAQGEEDPI